MSRPNEPSRPDLYTRITHQIVAQLEAGVRPWSQPWAASESVSRPLRHDGTPYRGVNVVLLWGEAAARGFQSSTWMTFRQALALGAHVRKGEKGSTVVYADQLVRIDDDDAGEETTRRIPFLKAYTVFNVEQIEGLPASSAPAPVAATSVMAAAAPSMRRDRTSCRCRCSKASAIRKPTTRRWATS